MRQLPLTLLLASVVTVGCGPSSSSLNEVADATSDAATCAGTPPVVCDGCCGAKYAADRCVGGFWTCPPLGGACLQCDSGAADAASACPGNAPVCATGCCGATTNSVCNGSQWVCPSVTCVSCNTGDDANDGNDGTTDAPSDDASVEAGSCAGARPLCFGSNASLCCGNDPSGPAACVGGNWLCGSAPAPGCNGLSELSCRLEAGSD